MKYSILFFAFLASILIACDPEEDDGLLNVTTSFTHTEVYEVRVQQGMPLAFSASQSVDFSDESEFSQFGGTISSVTVNELTYSILDNANFSNENNTVIEDATIVLSSPSSNTEVTIAISQLNLNDAVGQTFIVDLDQAALNTLAQEIQDTGSLTTEATIQLSSAASFDIELAFDVTVKGTVAN